MAVERPDAAAKVQGGETLAADTAVVLLAQLHAAIAGQAQLPAGRMKAAGAQRYHQVDRVEVGRAKNIQGDMQRLPTNIRGVDAYPGTPGMFGNPQLQARMIEFVALLGMVRQGAADAEQAKLAEFEGLAAVQVKKVGGGIAQVVEVRLGQREHPVRRSDAPVIPALASAIVPGDGAIDQGAWRPANGLRIELTLVAAERNGCQGGWKGETVHLTRPCVYGRQAVASRPGVAGNG